MNQNRRNWIIFFSLFIIYLIVAYFIDTNTEKNLEFCGVVQTVKYSIKGSPTVTINGSEYELYSNFWAFDEKIRAGDFLIKVKNTLVIKLVKKGTKEVIYFY